VKESVKGIKDFFSALECEYSGNNPFLDSGEYRVFRNYYGSFSNKVRRCLYKNLYQSRLRYVTDLLHNLKSPDVLDAGCGLGSESLLFSFLGASVAGVDLNERRLKIAEKRKLFYRHLIKGKVKFVLGNVFEVIKKQKFDIVWMNEAISHIHPAEDFLKLVYRQLNPGGRIVISEGNGSNPYILLQRFLRTGHLSWTSHFVQRPGLHKEVGYAVERLFTCKQITNILKEVGFFIGHLEFTPLMRTFLIMNHEISGLTGRFERWLERQKFSRVAALSYRIEGRVD